MATPKMKPNASRKRHLLRAPFTKTNWKASGAYVPRPDEREYDGPRDRDGAPLPSCFERWESARDELLTVAQVGERTDCAEAIVSLFAGGDILLLGKRGDLLPVVGDGLLARPMPYGLNGATRHLLALSGKVATDGYELESGFEAANVGRVALRVCRLALDVIEAALSEAVAENRAWHLCELEGFAALDLSA